MSKHSSSKKDFDLIVIGSGAGGGVASHMAARAGKKVAIVEFESVMGGECPNWGCVPTKSLLHAAELYENAIEAREYGIKVPTVDVNYKKIKNWKDLAVERTGTSHGVKLFERQGIKVIKGRAHFLDDHCISVKGKRYTSKKFLIATGTVNFIPPIPGLEEAGYITYREAVNLTKPPKSLCVIGGGAIGCEFATLFAIFGTKVHLIERDSHLLPKEDPENGVLLAELLQKNHGINVVVASDVVKVTQERGQNVVHFKRGDKAHQVSVETILVATGKKANVDLGLDNAKVEYTDRSIPTNTMMQTNRQHIYAAGDITGPYMFTHTASYQSKIAGHNILHRNKITADYSAIPRCVFTTPEVANVGATEAELDAAKIKYKSALSEVRHIGRANATNSFDGFVKIIVDAQSLEVLGASVVCPRAGEVLHELTLAVQCKLTANQIANTLHAFPTWSEAVKLAASKLI